MIEYRGQRLSKVMLAIRFASQYRVKEILTVIVGVYTVGQGTTLLSLKQPSSAAIAQIASVVSLDVMGLLMIVVAVILGMTATMNRRFAMWPSLALFIIYFFFTVEVALTIPNENVVPPAAWGFLLASMVCAVLTATNAFSPIFDEHQFGARTHIITEIHPDIQF